MVQSYSIKQEFANGRRAKKKFSNSKIVILKFLQFTCKIKSKEISENYQNIRAAALQFTVHTRPKLADSRFRQLLAYLSINTCSKSAIKTTEQRPASTGYWDSASILVHELVRHMD